MTSWEQAYWAARAALIDFWGLTGDLFGWVVAAMEGKLSNSVFAGYLILVGAVVFWVFMLRFIINDMYQRGK